MAAVTFLPHQALAVQVRGGGGGGGGRGGDLGPGVTKAGWRSDSHLFPGLQQSLDKSS